MTFKETLKKIWDFLWHSNSIWSLIVDVLLIFLIVKFLLLPGVGWILGTSLPLVIVESGSMTHEGDFNQWWQLHGDWYEQRNISKDIVYSWNFNDGMEKGDIILVQGNKNRDYKIGDVIIFKVPENSVPIIHRVVGIHQEQLSIGEYTFYETKGDHNDGQHPYETRIPPQYVLGKSILRIPYLGWIKLFFVELFK